MTPDPEQATIFAKVVGAIAAFGATLFGLFKLVDKKNADVVTGHGESIKELYRNQRSDKIELNQAMTSRANQLGDQITRVEDTQRQNRDEILDAIHNNRTETRDTLREITRGLAEFRDHVSAELAKRPTRDEMQPGTLYQTGKHAPGG